MTTIYLTPETEPLVTEPMTQEMSRTALLARELAVWRLSLTSVPDLPGAACTKAPELMEPEPVPSRIVNVERIKRFKLQVALAQLVCATCPMLTKCHDAAVESPPQHPCVQGGVWWPGADERKRERNNEWRARRRASGIDVIHGTLPGHAWHMRYSQPACADCVGAQTRHGQDRRRAATEEQKEERRRRDRERKTAIRQSLITASIPA